MNHKHLPPGSVTLTRCPICGPLELYAQSSSSDHRGHKCRKRDRLRKLLSRRPQAARYHRFDVDLVSRHPNNRKRQPDDHKRNQRRFHAEKQLYNRRPTKATNIHVTNPGLGRLHLEQHNIAGGYCSNGSSLADIFQLRRARRCRR